MYSKDKHKKRVKARKRFRIRKKVFGTPERPRLSVYRSLKHIHAQVIDDVRGVTLAAASSLEPELKQVLDTGGNREAAKKVGEHLARKALEKGIKKVVFDRGGRIYHGRIAALAEGAREAGLDF